MNKLKFILSGISVLSIVFLLASCDKSSTPTPVKPTDFNVSTSGNVTTVRNLSADPPSGGYNPTNGQPIGVTKKYTLFSLKNQVIIANTDSATNKWDIGFNGTNIIINSGTSGPGTASAQVVSGIFDQLTTAPDAGYLQDNKNASPASYAIPRGSGKGWYNYDPSSNVITARAGVLLVIKTVDGKYSKIEIQNYYQGLPTTPTSSTPDRFYSFRYLYQADGSTSLK